MNREHLFQETLFLLMLLFKNLLPDAHMLSGTEFFDVNQPVHQRPLIKCRTTSHELFINIAA